MRLDGLSASVPTLCPPPQLPPWRRRDSFWGGRSTGVAFLTHGDSARSSLASCSFHCEISLVFHDGSAANKRTAPKGSKTDLAILNIVQNLQYRFDDPWQGAVNR